MKELAQISQICYKCLHRRPKCLRFYSIPFGLIQIEWSWHVLCIFFDLDKMQLLSRPRLRVKALQTQLAQVSPPSPSIWSWINHDHGWSNLISKNEPLLSAYVSALVHFNDGRFRWHQPVCAYWKVQYLRTLAKDLSAVGGDTEPSTSTKLSEAALFLLPSWCLSQGEAHRSGQSTSVQH